MRYGLILVFAFTFFTACEGKDDGTEVTPSPPQLERPAPEFEMTVDGMTIYKDAGPIGVSYDSSGHGTFRWSAGWVKDGTSVSLRVHGGSLGFFESKTLELPLDDREQASVDRFKPESGASESFTSGRVRLQIADVEVQTSKPDGVSVEMTAQTVDAGIDVLMQGRVEVSCSNAESGSTGVYLGDPYFESDECKDLLSLLR